MRNPILALLFSTIILAPVAFAQDIATDKMPSDAKLQSGVNPQLWIYLEELRRYDDPKRAVRRKAEFRAAQRQKRLAAQKWFGYSNLRPMVSLTPFMDTYSPYWSGNTSDPFRWSGVGNATAVHISRLEVR